ncbi:RluA family pseudouridine synthase [Candidatus Methylacidiphilum infernorum]|uniref:Pseudouridylate synthase, 23S RNA-specific n=1 Tax=Methylacidiphilum infernorum (isolate V4) TaxID=481448 RepID=B3DY53_METI4|nr:RluA family pseudouridine synthase [Candidatus Methylacidiphilum infernorum]ACD82330.1 Pseudouridylate synthase, 23S RNA-specific [Methylacidiphilum infernorum V4]
MISPEPPYLPRIVEECQDYLIVDKPPFLLSHPTRKKKGPSILEWLQNLHPGISFKLIHRLDRETSGLLVVAKNSAAAAYFGRQMEKRLIQKGYLAISWGELKADYLKIEAPLGYLGGAKGNEIVIRQGIVPHGTQSVTEIYPLGHGGGYSLLWVRPLTGKLHQIRVHLSTIRHPVVGDKLYGPNPSFFLEFAKRGWTEEMEKVLLLPRHALHAAYLSFFWKGDKKQFYSPLPEDLKKFLGLVQNLSKLQLNNPILANDPWGKILKELA